jgi:deoxyhypusine synthase
MEKEQYLKDAVEHLDITRFDPRPLIEQFGNMAFQARNLARAAEIYDRMLADRECTVILCLAGSLFSAGLKKVVRDLVEHNMVDVIVSTGAIIVDQDFFEALGFRHYRGSPAVNDDELMKNRIDRIYDTFIDEDQLRECDLTVHRIAESLPPRPYSSREFIVHMGRYLEEQGGDGESVVLAAYRKGVPVFVPAFSDSSAGFGLVYHQWQGRQRGAQVLSIDSVKDFLELTRVKVLSGETGLFMIGGGVPKNFAQDVTVTADILGKYVPMHTYAVQITVADERDGGLSGSTLKEAHSWGKVDKGHEQLVFCEATIGMPLVAAYAFHRGSWRGREARALNKQLDENT